MSEERHLVRASDNTCYGIVNRCLSFGTPRVEVKIIDWWFPNLLFSGSLIPRHFDVIDGAPFSVLFFDCGSFQYSIYHEIRILYERDGTSQPKIQETLSHVLRKVKLLKIKDLRTPNKTLAFHPMQPFHVPSHHYLSSSP